VKKMDASYANPLSIFKITTEEGAAAHHMSIGPASLYLVRACFKEIP